MRFAIIGYGNLGKALASALAGTKQVSRADVFVCDLSKEALSLAEKENFRVFETASVSDMIAEADVICLAVKSYVFEDMVKTIDKHLFKDKLVISFMAGETISRIKMLLGCAEVTGEADISRIGEGITFSAPQIALAMPSLAIANNEGIMAYTKLPPQVASIFEKFGFAFEVEPDNIGKVAAFASCGLGFAAYLIDAFKTAGERLGFPPETALLIAAQTFKNASDTGLSSQDPDVLNKTVKAVAVPGGVTEQGINHMDSCDVRKAIEDAMQKAYDIVK